MYCKILQFFCNISVILVLINMLPNTTQAQVDLRVRVNSGSSGTSCGDGFFGGGPERHWRVNIAGQGWTTYPSAGICFTNPPNTQYDERFECPANYPATIQVCYRAFEDDGFACVVSQSCLEEICQTYPTPAPGTSATYTLSIPNCCGNDSWGDVNFTISAAGSFNLPGSSYDQICDAINLGTLGSGATIGGNNFGNFCAGNAGDPNPWGGNNDQGVWFQFTTSAFPSAIIDFEAESDPLGLGDGMDLQIALYESSNGTCAGSLTLIEDDYTGAGLLWDEDMSVECLQPNTTYYILVDGEGSFLSSAGEEGFFGLDIIDRGIVQAGDQICDGQNLGTVPDGGQVATPNLSQSNLCATNTNDPNPIVWSPNQPVWYAFQAPSSGHVIMEADSDLPWPIGTDAVDLQLALYESDNGTCTGNLTQLVSEYDPGLFDEDMEATCLTPGETYYLMVDGSGLNRDGIFDITIEDGGIYPAPNDEICDAIPLGQPAPGGVVGLNDQNNYCANNIFEPIPNNWGNDQGVWYTFIAPPSGKVEVRADDLGLFSDQIDLQLAVYDSDDMTCTGNLTELASEHEGFGLFFDEDMEVECLIPGRTYYLLVDGEGSIINPSLQEGIFDIEVYGDPRDPPAPNDEVCNAVALGDPTGGSVGTTAGPSHGSQNNFCADAAGEPQPSGFTANQTVWYTFIAPSTGNANISLTSDALIFGEDPIDLQIAVYSSSTGTCTGAFTEFVSGDDLLYNVDLDVFCLTPGETYFIQVDGAEPVLLGGHEGYFDINISELPPIPVAPNDLLCDAIALGNPFTSGTVGVTNQQNLCADDIGDPNPSAFGTDQTVWYTFETPATGGPYAVTVNATSSLPWPFGNQDAIDLQIAVYQSSNNTCTGSLTEVESEYDPIIFNESVQVQCLEAGNTYYVMVDGSWINVQGYFDIDISPATSVPIPVNDDICDHVNLGTVPIGGNLNNNVDYYNFCADTESGEPNPFLDGIEQTVWFSFQAPNHTGTNATSEVTISVENDPNNVGNSVDLQLAVYQSSNGTCTGNMSLLEDGSSDPLFSFDADVSVTCLTPGETYFVQVEGSIINREGYFTIEVEDDGSGVHPQNDYLCTPEALGQVPTGGSINNGINYSNLCSGTESGEPNPNAFGIEQTVWFTFQAPASGNVTIDLDSDPNNIGNSIDLQVALYYSSTNDCTGSFIEVDSDYNPFGFDESMSVECLVPGGTYFIQVDGAGGGLLGGEDGYFTIEVEDDGGTTNFPYNNDLCDAYNFGIPTGTTQTLNNETNECANVEFSEPGVGGYATNTVWYQFTAPPSGRVEIEVSSNSPLFGMDPEVHLFSSSNNTCTGIMSEIESSNWPGAFIDENIEATCLIPGNTYFIQVDGSLLVTEGDFTIEIEDMEPQYGTGAPSDPEPDNNTCADATPLTVEPESCFSGSGTFSQENYGQPTITYNPSFAQGCNDNCGDTWYSFTMPASGIALIEGDNTNVGSGLIGDFSDLTVVAYTGTCGNLTPMECDAGDLTNDVGFEVAAPPGSTVYLQVFNDEGDDDEEDFLLCVSEGCGADNCLNALAYPIQPNIQYCFNTGAANGEDVAGGAPGYFECGEGDNPDNSVYFYFVSDCNGSDVTLNVINAFSNGTCLLGTTPSDGFNISFFQDNTPCDNNPDALVDCQNFNSCDVQPINWSFNYTGLQPNTPYIIQIDGGFSFLGGDNAGYIMIETTTNPVVQPTATPQSCSGIADGTATATVAGGTAPFTFNWSNGATDSIITGLSAGTYYVTVTSANGCEDSSSVVVTGSNSVAAIIGNINDASCFGACDGSATVVGIGGTVVSGYNYQWDTNAGSQTTATATNLCPGTYAVTIYDNGACFDSLTVTIDEPDTLVASIQNLSLETCLNSCDASVTVGATGGTIAFDYTYYWPSGSNFPTQDSLCAGTYLVTVEDDNGCSDIIEVIVDQPDAVVASIANQTNPSCNGDLTGSVEVLASNGLAPYTYDIGTGAVNTNIFSNLAAGNYVVTVADASGCTDTASFIITEPPVLNPTLVSTIDVSCTGASDGEIIVSASGGIPTYEYSLDGINFTASGTFTGLIAGNYTITVRDANGCTATLPAIITEPTGMSIAINSQTDASCGACDASADITVSGGAGAYTYVWSNGETSQDPTALCAGTAIVTVTDANGCTASLTATIGNAAGFAVTSNIDQAISCFGTCDGEISLTPTGGTAPFTYAWDNGSTTQSLTGLCAGTYEVTITDVNNCFVVEIINLTEPVDLQTLVAELQGTSCIGVDDGQAIATPTGGTAPFTYAWDNGETTQTATALSAGTHTITVTDANSCTTTGTVTISAPTALNVTVQNIAGSTCDPTACDGTAEIVASGGTAPYTYLWPSGSTMSNPIDLCPGFNTVTVTDANGCTSTVDVNIPANTSLTMSIIANNSPTCFGDCDGSLIVSASGGNTSTPYSFIWDDPASQTSPNITGLCAGTYRVTISDADGCIVADSIVLGQPDSLEVTANVSSDYNGEDVSCNGESDGAIDATVTGGNGSNLFAWSTSSNAQNLTGLSANTYSLTVTDINGCTDTTSAIITEPDPLVLNLAITSDYSGEDISCNGATDGEVTATITGGTGAYTYAWSNGQTGLVATGLGAGTHTLTVTDLNGCIIVESITLTEPNPLAANLNTITDYNGQDISCNGESDGDAEATVTGGTGAYTYAWSNTETTPIITGLNAGTYTVTITDDNSCTITETITLTEPAILAGTVTVNQQVSCNGLSDAQATVNVTGGTAPFAYNWDNGETTSTAVNLDAGPHSLLITDANGCTAVATTVITEPAVLMATSVVTDVLCNGGNDGAIDVTVTGGTTPYSYAWSNAASTEDLTTVTANTYTVTITDANNCQFVLTDVVNEPTLLTASSLVSSDYNGSDVSCTGATDGEVTATGAGGTAPYTYVWDNGQATAVVAGLGAGTYTTTVTDAHGCTTTTTVTIQDPTPVDLDLNVTSNYNGFSISCNGGSDGEATATVTGGTGAYTYIWSDGQTTAVATGLSLGTYSVTITDANGCSLTDNVTLTEPTELDAFASLITNVTCNGLSDGVSIVVPVDGVAPYTYTWDNGETTQTATNLDAAMHLVTVTDANGCTVLDSVNVGEPVPLTITGLMTPVLCHGGNTGSITAVPDGGNLGYVYTWSTGATTAQINNLTAGVYTVTVDDALGCSANISVTVTEPDPITSATTITSDYNGAQISCANASDGTATVTSLGGVGAHTYNWSVGQSGANVTGLSAGVHYVTITDINGCNHVDSVEIIPPTELLNSTNVLSNYNGFDVSCNGASDGEVTANPSGGITPYTFEWSNGEATQTASNLSAGFYAVTITDANGCTVISTGTLTEPSSVSASIGNLQMVSCHGGSDGGATVTPVGGVMPYTYSWTSGETTQTATNLSPGLQGVTVTDANGCTFSTQTYIDEPDVLAIYTAYPTDVSCHGLSDGEVATTITGGIGPYDHLWSTGDTSPIVTGLAIGTYSVTVTDANGCTVSTSMTIGQPTPLVATATSAQGVTCYGDSDGSATATATGGVGPYTYVWSNSQTGTTATGLSANTIYNVEVMDANGCVDLDTVILAEPVPIIADAVITSGISCAGGSDGTASASATGGTPPYSYFWTNAQTGNTTTGLSAGIHNVTVTDANGCSSIAVVVLTDPDAITITAAVLSNVSCVGDNDGSAAASATGGTAPYTYTWSHGFSGQTVNNLPEGVHTVTATDANGCSVSTSVTITEPSELVINSLVVQDITCNDADDGAAVVNVSGGTPPYSYAWSNGSTNFTTSGLTNGTHYVTITDDNGCSVQQTFVVTEPTALSMSFTNVQDLSCNGLSDGQATVIVTGGTAPYTYEWSGLGFLDSTVTILGAGTYVVTVTDVNKCEIIDSVTIDDGNTLNVASSQSDVACFGDSTGSASVSVSGGSQPYTYAWSNGGDSANINNLGPGLYWCTITDAVGCEELVPFFIDQPDTEVSLSFLTLEVLECPGDQTGMISVSGQGGTPPYTYVWSHGPVNIGNPTSSQTVSGLGSGNYGVTMIDNNGCEATFDTSLVEPTPLTATSQGGRTNCYNSTDGSVSITPQGGTAPYYYYLMDADSNSISSGPDSIFGGLGAGTYILSVSDLYGCSYQVSATITRPDSVVLEVADDMVINMGDEIDLWVFMPVNAPFNPQVTWTPSNGLACDTCYQTKAIPTETTTYVVTIVGDDNCPVSADVRVVVENTYDVFIPNAFTPNSDRTNDVFMMYSNPNVQHIDKMMVFDRWGEMVYSTTNIQPNIEGHGWDGTFRGKPMNTGVFVYYFEVTYINGEKKTFKGDVTLLR